MNTQFKKNVVFLSVMFFILGFGIYFLFFNILDKNKNTSYLMGQINLQTNRKENIASLNKLIAENDSQLTKLSNSIVEKGGEVGFIENLEKLAHDNGLTVEISSLSVVDSANHQMENLTIKGQAVGNWLDSYKFLRKLESMQYKIKLDKFDLNLFSGLGKKLPDWQSNFQIEVLEYK